MAREKRCRNNISTLLSLMDFHDDDDDDLQTTLIQVREIKESHKKLSHIRRSLFKYCSNHDDNDNNIEDGGMKLMEFIRKVGGSEVKLVIKKPLEQSDVSSNQGRLLIPVTKVKSPDFLTEDEKKKLEKSEISVWVFDTKRLKSTLNLREWSMRSSKHYVLKTGWNQVVTTNELQKDMVIQVVSFRVNKQLCFALTCIGIKDAKKIKKELGTVN